MANRFRIKFAVYLLLRDGEKVLLSKRQNTGWMDGWWSLVTGHVDGNEAAEMAMIREAKEEAGIDIEPSDLRHVYTMHQLSNDMSDEYIILFFECTDWTGEVINAEPHKCGGLEWYNVAQLPANTLGYLRKVIETYPTGVTYSSEARM